jgi:hypothetical protein
MASKACAVFFMPNIHSIIDRQPQQAYARSRINRPKRQRGSYAPQYRDIRDHATRLHPDWHDRWTTGSETRGQANSRQASANRRDVQGQVYRRQSGQTRL